jgi:hypothetical protein
MRNTTSTRRAVLVGVASLAAVPSFAMPAPVLPDQGIFVLVTEITAAREKLEVASDELNVAEEAMHGWLAQNPQPEGRDSAVKELSAKSSSGGAIEYHKFLQALDEAVKADVHAAPEELKAERDHWMSRKKFAKQQSGLSAAEAKQELLCDAEDDIAERLIDTRALTLEGVQAKARAGRMIENDRLVQASVDDLLELSGETGGQS